MPLSTAPHSKAIRPRVCRPRQRRSLLIRNAVIALRTYFIWNALKARGVTSSGAVLLHVKPCALSLLLKPSTRADPVHSARVQRPRLQYPHNEPLLRVRTHGKRGPGPAVLGWYRCDRAPERAARRGDVHVPHAVHDLLDLFASVFRYAALDCTLAQIEKPPLLISIPIELEFKIVKPPPVTRGRIPPAESHRPNPINRGGWSLIKEWFCC